MKTETLIRLFILSAVMIHAAIVPPLRADEPTEWTFGWHKSEVTGLAFTPDGTKLITTSLRDDRISRIVAGEDQANATGDSAGAVTDARSHAVAVSPDGNSVAIAGFRVTSVYDLNSIERQWKMGTANAEYSPPYVSSVAFSPDGRLLASAGLDRTVRIWNTETGSQLTSLDVKASKINALSFSPDGSLLAAGGGDSLRMGEVRLWQMEDVIDE